MKDWDPVVADAFKVLLAVIAGLSWSAVLWKAGVL